MGVTIYHRKYDSNMRIYYREPYNNNLVETIISYLWLNKHSQPNGEFELIKDDAKGKVYRFQYDGCVYYLKCYAHRKAKKFLKNIFRPVEAVRCLQKGLKLMQADIAVAEPVLGLTWRRDLFFVDSIYVAKEVPGTDLYTYLSSIGNNNRELREKVIQKLALLWSQLLNHHFLHQDPGLRNFMVSDNNGDIQIILIDTDNIYSFPFLLKSVVLENLAKLRARQITDFFQTQTQSLSHDELKIFFEELSQKWLWRKLEVHKLQDIVNARTIKRLIKHNNQKLIREDDILFKYYSK